MASNAAAHRSRPGQLPHEPRRAARAAFMLCWPGARRRWRGGAELVGLSVEISPGAHLRLTEEFGTFLMRQGDLRGFKTSAWIGTVADVTLRTLDYGIEGLLGGNRSARDNRPLMDDIAALTALAMAAEHVG